MNEAEQISPPVLGGSRDAWACMCTPALPHTSSLRACGLSVTPTNKGVGTAPTEGDKWRGPLGQSRQPTLAVDLALCFHCASHNLHCTQLTQARHHLTT